MPNAQWTSAAASRSHGLWIAASIAGGLLLSPFVVDSQQVANVHPSPAETAMAGKRTSPINIDGKLDDAAWQQATPITAFRQFRPSEGAAPSLASEIRVLYDAH